MVTFTPPVPYAVDVVLQLPKVVPEICTVEPRLPTAGVDLLLVPLELLLELLEEPRPPPLPPPPFGSGRGLRA